MTSLCLIGADWREDEEAVEVWAMAVRLVEDGEEGREI
jgi:hypothetical protein